MIVLKKKVRFVNKQGKKDSKIIHAKGATCSIAKYNLKAQIEQLKIGR